MPKITQPKSSQTELEPGSSGSFGHMRLPRKVKSHSRIRKKLTQDSSKWATFILAHIREHFKALAVTMITESSHETGKVP